MSKLIDPKKLSKKSASDAPDLRGNRDQGCTNCSFFSWLPEYYSEDDKGLCSEYDFVTSHSWLCDGYKPFVYDEIALKSKSLYLAVKAVGDWEIEILAIPFLGKDSDNQWFDADTNTMPDDYPFPPIFYQHGEEAAGKLQPDPVAIGKSLSMKKTAKGWVLRALLDKTIEFSKKVWEAVKDGKVAVSSDSIAHLARLEVDGRVMHYEKERAGRITVWPLVGVSLWDMTAGNYQPASTQAFALPAIKAIYKDAGIAFPDIDTTGVLETAEAVKRRTEIIEESKEILIRSKKRRKI